MMKVYNTRNLKSLIVLLFTSVLFIITASLVSAFGVGVSGNLNLYPGQTLDIGYDIMNTIGSSSDIVVEGQFLEGSEIASFTEGNRFNVPAKSVVPVPVRYKVPANTPVGTVYTVKVIFKTVSEGTGSGSVSFAEDVLSTININVVEKSSEVIEVTPEKVSFWANTWVWIILIIIIIVIILWLLLKKGHG